MQLAKLYEEGDTSMGLPANIPKAVELLSMAATKSDSNACLLLGHLYREGKGMEKKDPQKAFGFYQMADSLGHREGTTWLGKSYLEGEGVERNKSEGIRLLGLAAELGDRLAQFELGIVYVQRKASEQQHAEGITLLIQAAEELTIAKTSLGWLYQQGKRVTKDIDKAIEWYRAAIKDGSADAEYLLGKLYHKGDNGEHQFMRRALALYYAAAEKGHAEANLALGELHWLGRIHGKGLIREGDSIVRSREFFDKAAEKGSTKAHYYLALHHCLRANDDPAMAEQALKHFTIAAEAGVALAQKELSRLYQEGGLGVAPDEEKAGKYLAMLSAAAARNQKGGKKTTKLKNK